MKSPFEICFRYSNPVFVSRVRGLLSCINGFRASTPTRWKLPNMHVCQPFPMRLFPIVRSKRASKKEVREVQRSLVPAIQGGSWSTKSPTYSTVLAAPADSIASFAQLKWSMPWPNEAHSTVTGEKKLYWKWSDGVWMIYMITNKYEYVCVFS